MTLPTPAYTDTEGAALFLSMTASSLKTLRWRGLGPPFSKTGHTIRYSYTDLRAWMEAHRTQPSTPALNSQPQEPPQ